MNWKIFTIVCVNSALILFPYNIIGCASSDADPHDYYVSFFHNSVSGTSGYEPFYYTNYQFLYETQEPVNTAEVTSAEWTGFGGNSFTVNDAYRFVCRFAHKDLSNLYYHLEKNQPLSVPDSVKKNGMTQYFLQQKNLEALGYIMYAKQVEPQVTGDWNEWEPISRDSTKMARLAKNGQQLMAVAKSDFIKLRYAYQVIRLAHYSGRYADCIKGYDDWIKPNATVSVLHELSLGLRAGALLRTGNKQEAAYTFSQLFATGKMKRVANYMSFDWCTSRLDENSRTTSLSYCKNNMEKANMLGLFVLGSNKEELKAIRQIYTLSPQAAILPVLVTREVNKLEEYFFTPSLGFAQGQDKVYIGYNEVLANDKEYKNWQNECIALIDFCKTSTNVTNRGFYQLAAAHLAMMAGDNAQARTLLDNIQAGSLSQLQKDQWAMTSLLVTINSKKEIDAAFEKELFTSLSWLEKKAATDREFAKFYRRLFADVLSAKYKLIKNKNSVKFMLCSGVADNIHQQYIKDGWGYYPHTLYDLRTKLDAKQVQELIQLVESKQLSEFEKFLVSKCTFGKNELIDLAGTTWLREHNFTEAEKWFKKLPSFYYDVDPYKTWMAANPFADLLMDTHAPTKQDTVKYTKLSFTQKMMRLEKELAATNDKEKKALLYYELAKGFYHMSYWGNSWMLVQYDWSGSEGDYPDQNNTSKKANNNYYSTGKAKAHYLAALSNTVNKNFQARCIYMAAKCDQKQVGNIPWNSSELTTWVLNFDKRNNYYSQLKTNFSTTPFYKEAFNTCSYLRDFVRNK